MTSGQEMNSDESECYERARRRILQVRDGSHDYLDLSGIGLTALPPIIGQLSNLKILLAERNKLRHLPPEIGLLSRLEQLYLSENEIVELPAELGSLVQLSRLILTGNKLTSLPVEINQLKQLSELYLLRNQLSTLPSEIGQLEALKELYLWGNQLTSLPHEIGQLRNLTVLNLVRNKLTELPFELRELTNLAELYLHGNPLLRLPAELLGPTSDITFHHTESISSNAAAHAKQKKKPASPKAIIDFYFSTRTQPLLEARIIIIGDGGVGKTSLARQLVHSQAAREGEQSTRRVVIEPWIVTLRETQVQINVWDFGGQEPMHAAHPYFFTERTLYLIVVSARDDSIEERIEYWLKMVARYGDGATALVVINKVDQHAMDIDRHSLALKYRFLPPDLSSAFFATSCTLGVGVNELRGAIYRQLDRLEQIWDRIPLEYFEVKLHIAKLQESNEDIISFERWGAICDEANVTIPFRRDQLLDLLRNLGLVISFPHEPNLNHLGVLNPEWVVEAIYPLLTSPVLAESGGLLTVGDIERLLPLDRYPKTIYGWLVDLMRAFELLFSDEQGRLLTPTRLRREVPDWALDDRWKDPKELCVELRYDVLPESVISRFIARKHAKAAFSGSWWRLGIALREQECEALVRAYPADGRIEISIIGPKLRRHVFLHGLRAECASLTENLGPERLWVVLPNEHYENYDELIAFAQEGFVKVPRAVHGRVIELDIGATLDLIEPHKRPEHTTGPRVEVYMTGDKKVADHGSVLIDGQSKVGDVSIIWNQQLSKEVSTSQLASELSTLRKALKAGQTPSDELDVAVGKLASAEAAAKAGDGPGAIAILKGIGQWVLDVATKIGTTVAAKVIESTMHL